ncbi:glycerophosphodiester phosphodiesterase family protein [Pelagibacterium luteolum]|uniref:Glycerophosphoryl diester phosphodiesterase n=1 Tax=Pelagibacterium luteolum TaxID=440168 RepID=A0A1G7X4H7_9HYPH|nr:glycerophosphodiester phosphodiesterase family protein [Pelagibacterium luteolum]SDG79026.1 Glycerophosphoryl diester phosphodiesterase [Pelagibacterium luteolum]
MTTVPFLRPIAHRGLHDKTSGVIENSASAFEAAIARGFGIECDLQLSADGEAVVFHDPVLDRLVGQTGAMRDVTAAEICAMPLLGSATHDCPQTFLAFLNQIAGRAPLVVELKHQADPEETQRLAARVAECIAGYNGDLVIKSFDPKMLIAVRKARYSGPLGIITYGYDRPDWYGDMPASQRFVLRHLLHYPVSRFTFISCERTALPLPAIRLFRALGQKVMSWTIKSPAEATNARHHADQIVFEGFDPDL